MAQPARVFSAPDAALLGASRLRDALLTNHVEAYSPGAVEMDRFEIADPVVDVFGAIGVVIEPGVGREHQLLMDLSSSVR